jgi:hypothetical protein
VRVKNRETRGGKHLRANLKSKLVPACSFADQRILFPLHLMRGDEKVMEGEVDSDIDDSDNDDDEDAT